MSTPITSCYTLELGDSYGWHYNSDMKIAKIAATGKIVELVRVAQEVKFSDELGWLLIDPDLGAPDMTGSKRPNIRWIPASTRFEWVRDVTSLALTVNS